MDSTQIDMPNSKLMLGVSVGEDTDDTKFSSKASHFTGKMRNFRITTDVDVVTAAETNDTKFKDFIKKQTDEMVNTDKAEKKAAIDKLGTFVENG